MKLLNKTALSDNIQVVVTYGGHDATRSEVLL